MKGSLDPPKARIGHFRGPPRGEGRCLSVDPRARRPAGGPVAGCL